LLITKWAKGFTNILSPFSNSDLKLPKLHSWVCHIVPTIEEHGVIGGFSTETYESLHKEWVKNPYRMSNRRGATDQMLKTVSCSLFGLDIMIVLTLKVQNDTGDEDIRKLIILL